MENFNLNWFKVNKELSDLEIETQRLKNAILEKQLEQIKKESEKFIINLKLVNDALTIILKDGSIITRCNSNAEEFKKVSLCTTMDELIKIISVPEIIKEKNQEDEKIKNIKNLRSGIEILKDLKDFVVKDNSVYLKGIDRTLPQLLVEEFTRIVIEEKYYAGFNKKLQKRLNKNNEYIALKNFFMWCCLNPRAEVANELYRFLKENSFRITKQGFFVALRNVVTVHGSNELVQFVSNTYNKVKAVWKKNPNDYRIFLQDGQYKLVHNDKLFEEKTRMSTVCQHCDREGIQFDEFDEFDDCPACFGTGEVEEYEVTDRVKVNHGEDIGGLVELYLDLPNRAENRFTDDWTKTFDIRVGQLVSMPMEECDWSTQDCAAAGLHFTSDQIHYVGCGDQSMLVLINPMKVVGIGEHKGRCYEYLPIMTVPREEATEILHDGEFDTLELDEAYAIRELEDIVSKTKKAFAVEATKHTFNIPNISIKEVQSIAKKLSQMEQVLSTRVRLVD